MSSGRKHILILRFSALGDVAILAPLLRAKMSLNPDVRVTVAAPPMLEPLFLDIPGVSYLGIDKHSGIRNIFRKLLSVHPTVVADAHAVIRSFILDFLFLSRFIPVRVLDKQRGRRKRLLREKNIQLACSWQMYDRLLLKCGLKGSVEKPEIIIPKRSGDGAARVGIAPFSTAKGKDWPVDKMEKLLEMLSAGTDVKLFFFGGKKYKGVFDKWTGEFPGSEAVLEKGFAEELELMKSLDVMVSMDSANVHFASAIGIPAVTVWGATHPFCGFEGWGQDRRWSVQAEMDCRPCSIYGGKPCFKGTYECMNSILPQQVYAAVMEILRRRG